MADTKPKKLSELELLNIVDNAIANSLGKMDTRLANDRLMALQYYNGELVGNLTPPEAEGRSKVVSMDVADTIEWILPSLIDIFMSGEDAVEYAARKPQDEPGAKQSTEWSNYVLFTQNEGFITVHDWFKDALLQKLGIVKIWWDDSEDITTEEYQGLSLEELTLMMQDGTVEPIQQAQNDDGTIDVKVKRTKNTSQIRIENVPPEEFLFSRKARTPQRIFHCHHRILRTVTELREAGYKNTDRLENDDSGAEFTQEAVERHIDSDEFTYGSQPTQSADPSMRFVWITESYMQVDWDADGLAEWRKIVKSGKVLLSNDEVDDHPFSMLTPIKMPHTLVGKSVADLLMDLQDIKTALMRQFIDNMYLQNNPRQYVDETKSVNIDDLLDSRVGGIVRGKGENGVTPLLTAPLSPYTFNLLEYIDQVKEGRSGVNSTFQGLDADTLNKTATGVNQLVSAAEKRIKLIARIFGETGFKDLFRKILKLSAQHQKDAQVIRLRGEYVQVDPRAWKTQYDIKVNVGLGTGNKDQVAAHLMNILNVQKEAAENGLPIVGPKQIYNAASKLVNNLGFKNNEEFFVDPDSQPGQVLAQQAAQKPSPEMAKIQADTQHKQAELQANQQLESAKLQSSVQLEQIKAKLKQETDLKAQQDQQAQAAAQAQLEERLAVHKAALEDKRERDKHAGEMQLRREEMAVRQWEVEQDNATKILVAQIAAQAAVSKQAIAAENKADATVGAE